MKPRTWYIQLTHRPDGTREPHEDRAFEAKVVGEGIVCMGYTAAEALRHLGWIWVDNPTASGDELPPWTLKEIPQ